MRHNFTRLLTIALVLTVACFSAFAEAQSEGRTVDVASLDLGVDSLRTIMASYDAARDSYQEQYDSIHAIMAEAYSKGKAAEYYEAKGLLKNLEYPSLSAEDTDVLASRIANEADSDFQAEVAQWLYANSRYYRPAITFSREVSSEDGSYHSSYRYVISAKPGSMVTLPSIQTTDDGFFAGWTDDPEGSAVKYEAGSEIAMPYVDTALYAVYTTGVRFVDRLTGVDVIEDGSEISAPELVAPSDSYIFAGWYSQSGEKADGPVTLDPEQAVTYTAGWKCIEVGSVSTNTFRNLCVPAGKQFSLCFAIRNCGNLNAGSLSVELVSEGLEVKTSELSTNSLRAGQSKSGCFSVVANGNSGDEIEATIVVTDADGNTWREPVTITIR